MNPVDIANKILKENSDKKLCIEADICYKCGNQLTEPEPTIKSFLGFKYKVSNQTDFTVPYFYRCCKNCNLTFIKWI